MTVELVAVKEMLEELKAMVAVCFEGNVEICGNSVSLELPNGQKFVIQCREA